jgi:hypothetical protein
LEREECDKETPELIEDEAMRILEQGDQDQPEDNGGDTDSKMDTVHADNAGSSENSATGPKPTAGGFCETSRKEKRRSFSPSDSIVSKRTRSESVSSTVTNRTSYSLPSLYYSTLNKREESISPQVLEGG